MAQSNKYKHKVTFFKQDGNNPDTDEPIYIPISTHYCALVIKGTGEPLFNKSYARISSYSTTLTLRKTKTSLLLSENLYFKLQGKWFNIFNIFENDDDEIIVEAQKVE